MRRIMIELKYDFNTECPECGEELIVIDNMNYITMICPKCHSTVFEELDGTIHVIKNGIMNDGYDASMDIFYKQFIAYSLYARNLTETDCQKFWIEKKLFGEIGNEDIFAKGIFDYYVNKMDGFKMKQPCIYFKGYEKYLEMSKPVANNFKKKYMKRK
jgi:ribosomal protein S27AE